MILCLCGLEFILEMFQVIWSVLVGINNYCDAWIWLLWHSECIGIICGSGNNMPWLDLYFTKPIKRSHLNQPKKRQEVGLSREINMTHNSYQRTRFLMTSLLLASSTTAFTISPHAHKAASTHRLKPHSVISSTTTIIPKTNDRMKITSSPKYMMIPINPGWKDFLSVKHGYWRKRKKRWVNMSIGWGRFHSRMERRVGRDWLML